MSVSYLPETVAVGDVELHPQVGGEGGQLHLGAPLARVLPVGWGGLVELGLRVQEEVFTLCG